MKRVYGSQKVKRGFYFDVIGRSFVYIKTSGEELPGELNHLYLSLNLVEFIFLILVMSISYVIFVPFVGWAIVCYVVFIHVAIFVIQKILCRLIKKICEAEHWLCGITNRLCKQCGKDCDDEVTMLVKGFVLSLFLLTGMAVGKYFLR